MSGQPYKYASDVEKFRAEYMASLGLRSDIDDLNLQANKTYKETGALPPVSQMKDNRTTAEILADTEKLKMGIMHDFKGLGSALFISSLIGKLMTSRLNSDGSFFVFVAQRAPEIASHLQKLYKYGIKGDANDVEKFVDFIENMYSQNKSMTESVKSFFNRPASIPGSSPSLTIGDMDSINTLFSEVAKKLLLMSTGMEKNVRGFKEDIHGRSQHEALRQEIQEIGLDLDAITSFIESDTYKMFTKDFINSFISSADEELLAKYQDTYNQYNSLIESLPKADILYTIIKQLDTSTKNKDVKLSFSILGKLHEIVGSIRNELDTLVPSLKALQMDIEGDIRGFAPSGLPKPYIPSENKKAFELSGEEMMDKGMTSREFQNAFFAKQKQELGRRYARDTELEYKKGDVDDEIAKLEAVVADKIRRVQNLSNEIQKETTNPRLKQRYTGMKTTLENEIDNLREHIDQLHVEKDALSKEQHETTGHGIKKRRGRPRGSGIAKPYGETVKASTAHTGIMESPRFVHFGKYLLNMHKLNNEGIFALKQPSGGNIIGNPSIKISKNLSTVIKKMVGGGVPTYNELSQLSEPEKVYLHKVSKKANIEDKFSIPTPSKDAEEKDMHQFEVMKGEIMSGNDNKDFIKKFKLLIMKLSKNGSLPKSEVNEILGDLAELGY